MPDMVRVSSKGQITIPARLRKQFKVGPGTYLRFVEGENELRLIPAPQGIRSLRGSVPVNGVQDFKAARHAAMEARANARNASN